LTKRVRGTWRSLERTIAGIVNKGGRDEKVRAKRMKTRSRGRARIGAPEKNINMRRHR